MVGVRGSVLQSAEADLRRPSTFRRRTAVLHPRTNEWRTVVVRIIHHSQRFDPAHLGARHECSGAEDLWPPHEKKYRHSIAKTKSASSGPTRTRRNTSTGPGRKSGRSRV